MDQIALLKWIAENGNPIGSEYEKDYSKYKADPTFRTLAMDLAENGNPIGRGDIEKQYLNYKDTIGTTNQKPTTPSTYQFQPGEREDLLANLHEVGYSGLDDKQKELYKKQYEASEYAKAGHTFEDAIKLADKQANQKEPSLLEKAQEINKDVRGGIGYLTSIPLSYLDALQTTKGETDIFGNERAVPRWPDNPSYVTRVGRSAEELQKEAESGEGLIGVVSDPSTVAQMGLAAGTLGSYIPLQLGAGAVFGGTGHLLNTKDPTLKGTAISSGIGALSSGLGAGIFGAPERRLSEKMGDIAAIEGKLAPINERIPVLKEQLSDLIKTQADAGDLKTPSSLGIETFQQCINSGKDIPIADLQSQIAQQDELIKAMQYSGIRQHQLQTAQEQKAMLERELLERRTRPLFPTVSDIVGRNIKYSSPTIKTVIDKTGIPKLVDYVTSIPGEKTFKLTTGIGSVGSNIIPKYTEQKVKKIAEDPRMKIVKSLLK